MEMKWIFDETGKILEDFKYKQFSTKEQFAILNYTLEVIRHNELMDNLNREMFEYAKKEFPAE